METGFIRGNVFLGNTRVGDRVIYVRGSMRGNGGSLNEQCFSAVVIGFNGDKISIDVSGAIVHADPMHLFTESSFVNHRIDPQFV